MSENALVVVETLSVATVFGEGGVDDVLAKLRAEALEKAKGLDISTKAGRSEIASLAFKVARSKTALDEMGKSLVVGLKERTNRIDAERRRIRDECDRLKDEVRAPLTEWEDAEKRRCEGHEAGIKEIEALAQVPSVPVPSADIEARIARLRELAADGRDWQEFRERAKAAAQKAAASLQAALDGALAWEAEESGRKERAERERVEAQRRHDEEVAKAAAEAAERARQRALQDKANAEARAQRAKEALAKEKEQAAERLKREKEMAAQRERERIAVEQAREKAAAERREANERNRRKVSREIAQALMAAGLTEQQADLALHAMVSGTVPHVLISW